MQAAPTTVILTTEGPATTGVTMTAEPYGNATTEEIAAFLGSRSSVTQGWTGSLGSTGFVPDFIVVVISVH